MNRTWGRSLTSKYDLGKKVYSKYSGSNGGLLVLFVTHVCGRIGRSPWSILVLRIFFFSEVQFGSGNVVATKIVLSFQQSLHSTRNPSVPAIPTLKPSIGPARALLGFPFRTGEWKKLKKKTNMHYLLNYSYDFGCDGAGASVGSGFVDSARTAGPSPLLSSPPPLPTNGGVATW